VSDIRHEQQRSANFCGVVVAGNGEADPACMRPADVVGMRSDSVCKKYFVKIRLRFAR
jgi:hypothetical protein